MIQHLQPAIWSKVNRLMISKAMSEFAHERLIEPLYEASAGSWGRYVLKTDKPGVRYRFIAKVLPLDHWHVQSSSIEKNVDGEAAELDAQSFILDLRASLRIDQRVLPAYLQEIACTLYGRAYAAARLGLSAEELVQAGFQDVERSMSDGHPVFIANSARIGFDGVDYPRYAPEAAEPLPLIWLAGHRSQAAFSCSSDYAEAPMMESELGDRQLAAFHKVLRSLAADPEDYVLIPVHPWQWQNQLVMQFAGDIAQGRLIYLGPTADQYRPQQSIRTFFNTSQPRKHYVKTALSIRNMGFTRGLSPTGAIKCPAVNDWVRQLISQDPWLVENGFSILREVAIAGYQHRALEQASKKISDPYKEMLAAIWRESPVQQLKEGQRIMTMASLLHRDQEGKAVVTALIRSSSLSIADWLKFYLNAYLKPQLHCLYAHHLIFTPHGENVLLVLENNVPVRMIMKDIGEDIGIVNPEEELPSAVKHLGIPIPEDIMTLSVFTDAFDCFFRFLVPILLDDDDFAPETFWQLVASSIQDYQREQPQFQAKYQRYNLFAPTFPRNCLNRLQLTNNEEMVDLNSPDPAQSLQFAGTLENPIAPFGLSTALIHS